jgi:two-component system sensor histidine kinase QseC
VSLQRRLLLYLLICAPLVWAAGLAITIHRARHEINELYDTEIIHLARQVQATLPDASLRVGALLPPMPKKSMAGEADLRTFAIAVWNARGQLAAADREGVQIPYIPDAVGFTAEAIEGEPWRVYYLQSFDGTWLVAAGQRMLERSELVWDLTVSQAVPWVLVLPVLLAAMAWAVRRALAPLHHLSAELGGRKADDLRPLKVVDAPSELRPLVAAMNGLFGRIDAVLAGERRFTADAAHELRTPLAALRAQWDVLRRARGAEERRSAEAKVDAGLARMDRLVTQMLALARVESVQLLPQVEAVDWSVLVEQVMSDCFPLAENRNIELACEWPLNTSPPWPLQGSRALMTVLLRNLLDNGVRYAPEGGTVTLRIGTAGAEVESGGPPLPPEWMAQLGQRFSRPEGQRELGSGLGISIVQRIAHLHGLAVEFGTARMGQGVRVVLRPAGAVSAP